MPLLLNLASMKRGKTVGGNAGQAHHRSGLVERPIASEHPLHQGRLGSGEHVPDAALDLDRRAQGMLDAAAVEGVDGLELVQGDGELASAGLGDPAGEREHLLREASHLPLGPGRRKRDGEPGLARTETIRSGPRV